MNRIKNTLKRIVLWSVRQDETGGLLFLFSLIVLLALNGSLMIWCASKAYGDPSRVMTNLPFFWPFIALQVLIIGGYIWSFFHYKKKMLVEPGYTILRMKPDEQTGKGVIIDFAKNAMYKIPGTNLFPFSFRKHAEGHCWQDNDPIVFKFKKTALVNDREVNYEILMTVGIDFSKKDTVEFWQEVYDKFIAKDPLFNTNLKVCLEFCLHQLWQDTLRINETSAEKNSAVAIANILVTGCKAAFAFDTDLWNSPKFMQCILVLIRPEVDISVFIMPNIQDHLFALN